jgi:glutaredoxin
MKIITVFICSVSILAVPAVATATNLYKWVDETGHVEWRDTPPPPTAKNVEQRNIRTSTIQTSSLPYSVQLAVKNFPVTVWMNNCGKTCDEARALLNRRGVPFTEKDPQADPEGFKKVSGNDRGIPLLFVGGDKLRGYRDSDWNTALDVAGYPKTALGPVKPTVKPAAAPGKPAPPPPAPPANGTPAPAR